MLLLVASILIVVMSYLLSSYISFVALKKVFGNSISAAEQLILGLGFGPAFVVTLCYYLLLFSPFQTAGAYVLTTLLILVSITVFLAIRFRTTFQEEIVSLLSIQSSAMFDFVSRIPILKDFQLRWKDRPIDVLKLLLLGVFIYIVYGWLEAVAARPLTGHDVLEYALLADTFLNWLNIDYSAHIVDESTGFYFLGLHGYAFPLLGFWEKAVNSVFGVRGDYFFRAATGYYGLLSILLIYYFMKRFNIKVAIVAVAMLFSSYAFFIMLREYHIDAMRMFGLLSSWLLLYYTFKEEKNRYATWILGFALGVSSFIHSINFMVSCFAFLSLALFLQGTAMERFNRLAGGLLTFFLFGAFHYVLDLLIGSGWILKDFLGR